MGRKPNALIVEFFERGQKLADSSNRYEHACKKCGKVFPKGRPDSLSLHLFEQCPNLTDSDRDRAIVLQLGPGTRHPDAITSSESFVHTHPQLNGSADNADSLQREPSALDTLAEVSRQHLDLSRQRIEAQTVPAGADAERDQVRAEEDEGLFKRLRESLDDAGQSENRGPDQPQGSGLSMMDNESFPLVQTASAATALQAALGHGSSDQGLSRISEANERHAAEHLDPRLQADVGPSSRSSLSTTPAGVSDQSQPPAYQPSVPDFNGNSHQQHAPQHHAFAEQAVGFGLLQRPLKRQKRGKFSDTRRKEVQGIRKLGACIRCRMLKKPCSGDTPCSTCRSIESARLWKSTCVRTRLADEFKLYNSGYFRSIAENAAPSEQTSVVQKAPGRIEVTLFPNSGIVATFWAVKVEDAALGQGRSIPEQPSAEATADEAGDDTLDNPSRHGYMIDLQADDVTGKLERYLVDMTDRAIEADSSEFMRACLTKGIALIGQNGDVHLARTVNLWIATSVIASAGSSKWQISHRSDMPPSQEPESIEHASPQSTAHRFDTSTLDYTLIDSQLSALIEQYCASQSKSIMNELERRLLQRVQSSSFTTFLVAVILLNCIERLSYFHRSIDPVPLPEQEGPNGMANNLDVQPDSTSALPEQPRQPDPTVHPWMQGESFANLLHLLLRIRGLPPKTVVHADNTLAVISDNKPGSIQVPTDDAVAETMGLDVQIVHMAQWLAATGVKYRDLETARSKGHNVMGDGGWDLRFIAPLLMPS